MRIQLESPQSSGHTNFTPAVDDDVLMEDEIVAASPEHEQEQEDEDELILGLDQEDAESEEGAVVSDECLAVLGITTSEQLIQRLKSKDDIDAKGKSKIYVAFSAFNDTRVPIAKKTFLLTDWVLDAIVKNAKELPNYKLIDLKMDRKVLAELLIHDGYWKLLIWCIDSNKLEPADLVLLANKHPLPALLQSSVYFWRIDSAREMLFDDLEQGNGSVMLDFFDSIKAARTSKQVLQLDSLNQCLASWLSASPLPSHQVLLREDPKTDLPLDLQLSQYLSFLEMVIHLWLAEASKANNSKKVQDFYLAELLPLHTQVLWWLQDRSANEADHFRKYRAITSRISYQSLVIPDQLKGTPAAVLRSVADHKSKGAYIIMWTYLSQLCIHHKDMQPATKGGEWVKEKGWRRELFQSVVSPAVELMITLTDDQAQKGLQERKQVMTSLNLLHQAANRWNLHFSDEDDLWRILLERSVDSILSWYHESLSKAFVPDMPQYDEEKAFREDCAKALVTIHELDESIIDNERRTRVILCALDQNPYEKGPSNANDTLLAVLCGTSIKSRRVVDFVQSCQIAMDQAVVHQSRATTFNQGPASGTVLKTTLFQKQYWQQSLGVAVRDFISADEVVQLLTLIKDKLEKRCADVHSLTSTKKRKAIDEMSDDTISANQLFSLAIVPVYFACALVGHIAIPRPAYEAAQTCLSLLQADVIHMHLDWTLSSDNDESCDALATALLKLHESIQLLASACGKEQEEDSTWSKLASQWDSKIGAYQHVLSTLMTQATNRKRELLVQAYLSILHLTARGTERQSPTPFDSLLRDSSTLYLLSEAGFDKLCHSERHLGRHSVPADSFDITHFHACVEVNLERPAAWSLVGSPFLSGFERMASNELLQTIAHQFVSLIKPDEPRSMWDVQSWKVLSCNSSNLELPRWREAVCTEMRRELEKSSADTRTTPQHSWVIDVLALFPRDWLPTDLRTRLSEHESMLNAQSRTSSNEMTFGEGGPLGLTAFRFCTLQNHPLPSSDDSPQHVLATQCRLATAADYEVELDDFLKALKEQHDRATDSDDDSESEKGACGHGFSPRSLLQTLSIMLCNSPEGTLLVSQRCLTGVIATLLRKLPTQYKSRTDGPSLSCIQFIETVLSTKPILFRSADISAVFTLATQVIVAECSTEAPSSISAKKCFLTVSTTLIECIRLRRDYVSHYLPQLTMLLVRMLQAFQRENKTVQAGSLGLEGLEEAKVFNRLMSNITAKSTSTFIGGLPESKMKSLAKSFSTHAPYVIVAFARNMTLPTFARGETRDELIRAIYELCDIIGPWQKNVMMDMLADEAERIVMRSLWRGWEVQRYKGA